MSKLAFAHPWLARIRPTATFQIAGARVELYSVAPTNLHRVPADVLILPADGTLRMVRGFRKQVRDYGGFNLIEQEVMPYAPLEPRGVLVSSGGRTKFKQIVHCNIYDEQYTTDTSLQQIALGRALEQASQLGAQTVAFADYTIDLRRALAEETALTIAQAISQRPANLQRFRIVCTDPVNAWVYQQVLGWVTQSGLAPYPRMVPVRHTAFHLASAKHWSEVPAHGLWHFTDTTLNPNGEVAKLGKSLLQTKMRELAPLPVGDATITPGGALLHDFVVHLALSEPNQPTSVERLQSAVRAGISLSHHQSLRTLLIPMPTTLNGVDRNTFAQTVVDTLNDFFHERIAKTERVILLGTDTSAVEAWQKALEQLRDWVSLPALEAPAEVASLQGQG